MLQNKYYFDELYHAVFIKGTQRLANWLFKFDSNIIDDTIVDGVGWLGRRLSEIGHWFDAHIVDGAVNGVGAVADWFGGALRDDPDRQGAELPAGRAGRRVGAAGRVLAAAE